MSIIEEINMLEIDILVHSCIYYRMDSNLISDTEFDAICQRLVSLKGSKEFMSSKYYEAFKDFDGSTGFNLPLNLPNITSTATYLMDLRNKGLI